MGLNHNKNYNQDIRRWLFKVFDVASKIAKKDLDNRPCPVCGTDESRFYANNDFLDYMQCDLCGLIYMNPAPATEIIDKGFQGEDEILNDYFSIMQKYKTQIPKKPNPKEDNKLCDIYSIKQEGRLLDIGCSVGDFLHKAKYWYEVEGVEINQQTADIAGQYFKVYRNFLPELDLSKCYDIVTMHQILYGVPDPVGLLKNVHKILKDDGILYINSPNADSYALQIFKGKSNHLYGYTTLNVFNKKSLEELCRHAGFKIIFFRTEWMDVYLTDIKEYYDHPKQFVHKRNTHLPNYEGNILSEDALQKSLNISLGDKGNYFVAILEKLDSDI